MHYLDEFLKYLGGLAGEAKGASERVPANISCQVKMPGTPDHTHQRLNYESIWRNMVCTQRRL